MLVTTVKQLLAQAQKVDQALQQAAAETQQHTGKAAQNAGNRQ